MAKVKSPFKISGKLGDHVYYQRNGKQLVRKKPAPRKSAPSLRELMFRSKFGFMIKFLLPINSLIRETFKSENKNPMNEALSANLKHVVPDSYPDWRVDFSRLSLGKGDIPGARDLQVSALQAGQLLFNWNGKSRFRGSMGRDLVYVAVYCEDLQQWLMHVGTVCRKDGSFILDAEPFSGFRAHVYFGFISELWGGSSDSQFLGSFDLTNDQAVFGSLIK